jgi:Flp pilus assembly secretin CpaC
MNRFFTAPVAALIAGVLAMAAPALAQEYVLPSEAAAQAEVKPDPDTVVGIQVAAGRLEVVQIPVENLGRATVISSSPEIADIHVEDPGLLFVFGRVVGQTVVVVANEKKDPVYTTKVTVVTPEDQGG